MAWFFVICAGIFEIVGVIGMNGVARAKTPRSFATLFIGFAFSFTLLNLSLQTLPMGSPTRSGRESARLARRL